MNSLTTVDVRKEQAGRFLLAFRSGDDALVRTTRIFAHSRERLRLRLYCGLFVADLLCLALAFLIAGGLRLSHDTSPLPTSLSRIFWLTGTL